MSLWGAHILEPAHVWEVRKFETDWRIFTYEPLPETENHYLETYARQEEACAFSCPADVPTTMRSRISACPTQKVAYVLSTPARQSWPLFLKAGYELLFYDVSRDLTLIF